MSKIKANFLILSTFVEDFDELNRDSIKWGYELKIVDTKTLKEHKSISVKRLKIFQLLEKHLQININKLKKDIMRLQNIEL